jgi:flagellar motility protein MotE (MotC chaperone)
LSPTKKTFIKVKVGMMRKWVYATAYLLLLSLMSPALVTIGSAQGEDLEEQEVVDITEVLLAEKKALSAKEEALRNKETQLKVVEQDILAKIEELKTLKKELDKIIALQEAENKKRDQELAKLAKVYEATPPQQAARILSKLDTELAAWILIRINPRKAGKIWGYIEPNQGAKISTKLGGRDKYYGGRGPRKPDDARSRQ